MIVKVTYEQGVFRPERPVDLAEGAKGEVIMESRESYWSPQEVAAELRAIAAISGPSDNFSGEDHDEVLYGERGAG